MKLIDISKFPNYARMEWVEYTEDTVSLSQVYISSLPVVDAVPVVRCKDCKYWWKVNELCTHERHCDGNLCQHQCGADDFCSDGVKK